MSMTAARREQEPHHAVIYPESDGKPISDHTLQFEWIVAIKTNLEAWFAQTPDVFVAGDLLWYPVEGSPVIRAAPDAMVVFGRPKNQRGSYQQWKEDDIAPQVVFEIWSPGNRIGEMVSKFLFYQRHGVEEYYLYDPFRLEFYAWRRGEDGIGEQELLPVDDDLNGYISPLLGIRFDFTPGKPLQVFLPNGEPFQTFTELRETAARETEARMQAEQERTRAEQERTQAEQKQHEAEAQTERLAARLRELGVNPDTI